MPKGLGSKLQEALESSGLSDWYNQLADTTNASQSFKDLLNSGDTYASNFLSWLFDPQSRGEGFYHKGSYFDNRVRGTLNNDTLTGDTGRDYITGSNGSDTISGLGNDDKLRGGNGNDSLDGGNGNDRLSGDAGNDTLTDGDGNDRLYGDAGNDTLTGGDGSDRLDGGAGNDVMNGGAGNDRYYIDSVGDTITEATDGGTDSVYSVLSYVLGANLESLHLMGKADIDGVGNGLANSLHGNRGANDLAGLDGNDQIFGHNGNDVLDGGAGDDVLYGGSGDDHLIGGAGTDILSGGTGADIFFLTLPTESAVGSARDVIKDFASATDRIDLSGIDANANASSDQAFSFIGDAAFTHVAGQLRFDGTTHILSGDTNGDATPDFEVSLLNIDTLTSSVFAL